MTRGVPRQILVSISEKESSTRHRILRALCYGRINHRHKSDSASRITLPLLDQHSPFGKDSKDYLEIV